MAHADYDCCAICDSKINYNGGDAATKGAICPDCIERTAKAGRLCARPSQMLELLGKMSDGAALAWLHAVGFSPCYYENDVDAYLIERGLVAINGEGGKWGHELVPLPSMADEKD